MGSCDGVAGLGGSGGSPDAPGAGQAKANTQEHIDMVAGLVRHILSGLREEKEEEEQGGVF